jgi:hypothetical protein
MKDAKLLKRGVSGLVSHGFNTSISNRNFVS